MQGQGLESLIPNKNNNNQNNQKSDYQNNQSFNNDSNNQNSQNFQSNQNQSNQTEPNKQNFTKPPVIKGDQNKVAPIYYPEKKEINEPKKEESLNDSFQNTDINNQNDIEEPPFKIDLDDDSLDEENILNDDNNFEEKKEIESNEPNNFNNQENLNQFEDLQNLDNQEEPIQEKKEQIEPSRRKGQAVFNIEVDKIKPNPFQPRKEYNQDDLQDLAHSIREVGIIQPLVVSKIEESDENGIKVYYQLIAGERRLRASKILGLKTVPAIVRSEETKQDKLSMALIENIQRADLNPIETARAYSKLQDDFSLTQREIATRVGKSRESVSNTLRLLNLPTDIQNALSQGKINESQTRVLLSVKDPILRDELFKELLTKEISTRKLRSLAKGRTERKTNINNKLSSSHEENFWAKQLEDSLGIPVSINNNGTEKRLIFKLHTQEEWDSLMTKLINSED